MTSTDQQQSYQIINTWIDIKKVLNLIVITAPADGLPQRMMNKLSPHIYTGPGLEINWFIIWLVVVCSIFLILTIQEYVPTEDYKHDIILLD